MSYVGLNIPSMSMLKQLASPQITSGGYQELSRYAALAVLNSHWMLKGWVLTSIEGEDTVICGMNIRGNSDNLDTFGLWRFLHESSPSRFNYNPLHRKEAELLRERESRAKIKNHLSHRISATCLLYRRGRYMNWIFPACAMSASQQHSRTAVLFFLLLLSWVADCFARSGYKFWGLYYDMYVLVVAYEHPLLRDRCLANNLSHSTSWKCHWSSWAPT